MTINYNKQNPPPFECLNDNSFINVISKLNKNTIYKKKAKKNKSSYIKDYSARLKTRSFIKEIYYDI